MKNSACCAFERRYITAVVTTLLDSGAVTATKIISPRSVIRATRQRYAGRFDRRGNTDIRLTMGSPNYSTRRFIRECRAVGEPFPVKKIRLTFVRDKKRKA